MMIMKRLTLPLVVLLLSSLTSLSIAETKNIIASFGTIDYRALSCRRYLSEHWRGSPELYAEKADMYTCHLGAAEKVQQIKKIRPDLTCLLYRNIREVYQSASEYQGFINNGWLLKDMNGNYIVTNYATNRMVDVGSSNYQQWLANWIKGYLDQYGFDGAYLDNCLPSRGMLWGLTSEPINPRTGKPWTDQEFKEAVITLVNKVKDTVAPKLVIGNGIFNGEAFFGSRYQNYVELLNSGIDGVMSEGWVSEWSSAEWYSEEEWLASIDFVVWLEDNFLPKGKIFIPVCANAASGNLPLGCSKEQYAAYCYASLLLAARTSGAHYVNFYYYMVEDYPQSLFTIDVGTPSAKYYVVPGTHVYARDFTKSKVLVNPTSQPYTINLTGQYQTLNGTPITSPITLKPHTGTILKKVADNAPYAKVFIEHPSRGHLVVDIGIGETPGANY